MFKKILILICILSAFSAFSPVYTASAAIDNSEKEIVLTELGLLDDNGTTYDKFVSSLMGFLYNNTNSIGEPEDIVRRFEMIGVDEKYDGDDIITVHHALKFAVITLGYKIDAENSGGFPDGYIQTATKLGLTDGISFAGNELVKKETVINILYNMIEAKPMLRYGNGGLDNGYVIESRENLLSLNRDIYKIEGIITGTELTSIYGENYRAGKDAIAIDKTSYYVKSNRFDNLLGKNAIVYLKELDSDEYEVVYAYEDKRKNSSVIVECDNIESIGDSFSTITYYNDADKKKTLKIIASPRVIYNGILTIDYTKQDFMGNGFLELIDHNKDGKYEVIKITSYETMVVEAVSTTNFVIKNRYRFEGCLQELNLETSIEDKLCSIYSSAGTRVSISSIKVDDILSVAKSKDGRVINIYISGVKPIEGKISRIDDKKENLGVGDKNYKISYELKKHLENVKREFESDKTYTFFADYFGNIVYIKEHNKYDYKLLLKMYHDADNEIYYGVYMDMNNDWYTVPVSSKLVIDGNKCISLENAIKSFKTAGPQIVLIKQNLSGEIIDIDTAAEYNGNDDNGFCKTPLGNYTYRYDAKSFQNNDGVIYAENDAKVIVIPTEDVMNKENWQISTISRVFGGDQSYNNLSFYNPDKYMFTGLITVYENGKLQSKRRNSSMFVITDIYTSFVDGEALPMIACNVGKLINMTFAADKAEVFKDCKIGDVVNLYFDVRGRVSEVLTVASLSKFELKLGAYHGSMVYHLGKVVDVDHSQGKLLMDCGTKKMSFRITPSMSMIVFDASEKTCVSKTVKDISIDDKVVIKAIWGSVKEVVCCKE